MCIVSFPFSLSHRAHEKYDLVSKNKMENLTFVDEEDIPLINQDQDYDDYNTLDTRVEETSFTVPDITEATSTLCLGQKLKRDKIVSLYRYLDATGHPGLASLDRFNIKRKSKTGNTELPLLDSNKH